MALNNQQSMSTTAQAMHTNWLWPEVWLSSLIESFPCRINAVLFVNKLADYDTFFLISISSLFLSEG